MEAVCRGKVISGSDGSVQFRSLNGGMFINPTEQLTGHCASAYREGGAKDVILSAGSTVTWKVNLEKCTLRLAAPLQYPSI